MGTQVELLQNNRDRHQIVALATRDGSVVGFGPLDMDRIFAGLYSEPYPSPWHPRGDPALGSALASRQGEFHDLADFYGFYGYPQDLLTWIASTPPEGSDETEVAGRLGVEPERLHRGAVREAVVPGAQDPAGSRLPGRLRRQLGSGRPSRPCPRQSRRLPVQGVVLPGELSRSGGRR